MEVVLMIMYGNKWEGVMGREGELLFGYIYKLYSSRNYVTIRK